MRAGNENGQALACPTNSVAEEEGFEPSHAGIKIRCLNQLGDSPAVRSDDLLPKRGANDTDALKKNPVFLEHGVVGDG
ncbi:MAG: hypothetical protein RIR18_869 [Pseudomonadota bacterium]